MLLIRTKEILILKKERVCVEEDADAARPGPWGDGLPLRGVRTPGEEQAVLVRLGARGAQGRERQVEGPY